MNDQAIEQQIQAKGLTAPRITPDDLKANIASEHYFTANDGAYGVMIQTGITTERPQSLQLLTFCVLVLRNGFTVTGESACASPENFNVEIGRNIARDNAINKVWPLMGYHLKQQLHEQQQTKQPTHICKECGALWKLIDKDVFPGSGPSWSLTSSKCGACCDNVAMGDQIKALQPHELRVVVEAAELADKIEKLQAFGKTEPYASLSADERARLIRQLGAMQLYHGVLLERVDVFTLENQ